MPEKSLMLELSEIMGPRAMARMVVNAMNDVGLGIWGLEGDEPLQSAAKYNSLLDCPKENSTPEAVNQLLPVSMRDSVEWANRELAAGLKAISEGRIGEAKDYSLYWLRVNGYWWQAKELTKELRKIKRRER